MKMLDFEVIMERFYKLAIQMFRPRIYTIIDGSAQKQNEWHRKWMIFFSFIEETGEMNDRELCNMLVGLDKSKLGKTVIQDETSTWISIAVFNQSCM